jgi:hypothetical protein
LGGSSPNASVSCVYSHSTNCLTFNNHPVIDAIHSFILFSLLAIQIQATDHRIWNMSMTYISNQLSQKELNVSKCLHTIDIIQLLKAGLTDK